MDDLSTPVAESHSLMVIETWPTDLDQPLFRHYPAMKLGCRTAAALYAGALAAMVETVRAAAPAAAEWVLMPPPIYRLPAGANLIARALHGALAGLALIEPQLERPSVGNEYASTGVAERVANRRRQHATLDKAELRTRLVGKSVLVINDINVTGTQQAFMRQLLHEAGAARWHWLYVFTVDPVLGRGYPQLEFELNNSRIRSLDSFCALLADPNTDPTARCIERLFALDLADFARLATGLAPDRRHLLHDLITHEGRYGVQADKLQLLERKG